jgi:hypothetical protein
MGVAPSTLPPAGRRSHTPVLPARRYAPPAKQQAAVEDRSDATTFLQLWWPALIGLVLAFLAPGMWDRVRDAWGDMGAGFVFPYVLISGHTEFGISTELASNLKQIMVLLQFPLEGLVATWGLARGLRTSRSVLQVVFLHALGVFVVWLLSQPLFG